jgi:hypothetical protein
VDLHAGGVAQVGADDQRRSSVPESTMGCSPSRASIFGSRASASGISQRAGIPAARQ